jgi:hypothetical protein
MVQINVRILFDTLTWKLYEKYLAWYLKMDGGGTKTDPAKKSFVPNQKEKQIGEAEHS